MARGLMKMLKIEIEEGAENRNRAAKSVNILLCLKLFNGHFGSFIDIYC